MRSPSQTLLQGLGHLYATANDHHVDVAAGPFEKQVPHVATHDVAVDAYPVGHIAYCMKDFLVEKLSQFGI